MVQRTTVTMVDDKTGEEIPDGEGQTVQFSYRGRHFAVDLGEAGVKQFDDDMADWIEIARPDNPVAAAPKRRRYTQSKYGRTDPMENRRIRQWAGENGYKVADRARIPYSVRDAYYASIG